MGGRKRQRIMMGLAGFAATFGLSLGATGQTADAGAEANWAVVVHGGAGMRPGETMATDDEAAVRAALAEAAEAAAAIVADGGDGLDAVEAAIRILEDHPRFNAGRGAVFTAAGANELDASIMDGTGRRAGAVAGVTRVRNPITLARTVMDRSPHVMMAGAGAEAFAEQEGITLVEPAYFATKRRWEGLLEVLERRGGAPPAPPPALEEKWGTVGAAVLDRSGGLSAGTSTGGITGKLYGRVGDSPVIGAGTYAEDGVCAISATGHGEVFIRAAVARTICARADLSGESLQQAADAVIQDELTALRADGAGGLTARGGVIFAGPGGETGWAFNTPGMFRARITADAPVETAIYGPGDRVAEAAE